MQRFVLEHVTGRSRTWLLTHDYVMTQNEQSKYDDAMLRLMNHEPVQYIFRSADFAGMELYVDENVLIPRPETEELVQWILEDYASLRGCRMCVVNDGSRRISVMDACTGSGCIALALKNANPAWDVHGFDISDSALLVAQQNSKSLGLPLTLRRQDLMSWADNGAGELYDIIVCNPPYIMPREAAAMSRNVLDYEPHAALFVEESNPLAPYAALAMAAKKHLTAGGAVYAEINPQLAQDTADTFLKHGFEVLLRHDMQGRLRMLKAFITA